MNFSEKKKLTDPAGALKPAGGGLVDDPFG